MTPSPYRIVVDESGKLEQPGETIFAYANDRSRVIRLKARDRDACMQQLPGRRFQKTLRIFAACLFLLLKDIVRVSTICKIVIDNEYTKHDRDIKTLLLTLLEQHQIAYPSGLITVENLSKKNPADQIAGRVRDRTRHADETITATQVLAVLSRRKRP